MRLSVSVEGGTDYRRIKISVGWGGLWGKWKSWNEKRVLLRYVYIVNTLSALTFVSTYTAKPRPHGGRNAMGTYGAGDNLWSPRDPPP